MKENELTRFINKYGDHIFEDHINEIKSYIELMHENEGRRIVNSIYGEHYVDCIYALDANVLGPETCECVFFQMRGSNISNFIKKYKNLLIAFNNRDYK